MEKKVFRKNPLLVISYFMFLVFLGDFFYIFFEGLMSYRAYSMALALVFVYMFFKVFADGIVVYKDHIKLYKNLDEYRIRFEDIEHVSNLNGGVYIYVKNKDTPYYLVNMSNPQYIVYYLRSFAEVYV